MRYRYPRQKFGNNTIIVVDRKIQPFSFAGHIFLNPALYSEDELSEIVAHEKIHCRQRHTIDILLAEALVCFFWFNPAAWLLRRDLKQNLEFFTDRMTLRLGFDRKHYQYCILRVANINFQIVNYFYFNNLKKRIIMINKKETSRILAAKYLLVLPVLAAVFLIMQSLGLQAKNFVDFIDDIHIPLDVVFPVEKISENEIITAVIEKKKEIATVSVIPSDSSLNNIQFWSLDSNPLYILEGKIISHEEMSRINPKTIESITVLKDKLATDLYGEQAKNGVIITTLKTETDTVSQIKTFQTASVPTLYLMEDPSINFFRWKIADSIKWEIVDPDTGERVNTFSLTSFTGETRKITVKTGRNRKVLDKIISFMSRHRSVEMRSLKASA
jgi:hypothetical protein